MQKSAYVVYCLFCANLPLLCVPAESCQMKKVVKTVTTRTVLPSMSDTMSLDGGGSLSGGGGYVGTLDRVYRQGPGGDYPTATVPRNYHYGPTGGYDSYMPAPHPESYVSLSRGARLEERYR